MSRDEVETTEMKCPDCKKDAARVLSVFGSYTISGNNSASTRPKGIAGRKKL
jgi:hypothetical protein